jgi:soluble lytic murein transglycosylase-like protein
MNRILHLSGIAALALPLWAGEYVVLGHGFRLHADRHEVSGGIVRIFSAGGVTEMAASAVEGYELEDAPAPESPVREQRQESAGGTACATRANVGQAEPPAQACPSPQELASEAAKKYSLPESFVRSVMRAESGFEPTAVSPKGAVGLMQLMPETARQLGIDPSNPRENAAGGAQYLLELLAKYEHDPNQVILALAAYNAGPGAVERYHGVPPFRETREYILRVLRNWNQSGIK